MLAARVSGSAEDTATLAGEVLDGDVESATADLYHEVSPLGMPAL